MILVLIGTHELPFTRLLNEVEKLKLNGGVEEDIVVQNGHTPYESDVLTLKPFVSYQEMNELYDRARLIITHAGTGSVITGLKKGKKVIAAPRLKKYGEHNDDHQLELMQAFEEAGHILSWNDGDSLLDLLKQLEDFEPTPFQSKRKQMFRLLEDFIDNN